MARPPLPFLTITPVLLAGCVALQAPLVADDAYPALWARPVPLLDHCRSLAGTYLSSGISAVAHDRQVALSLLDALNVDTTAQRVSLEVVTQRLDDKGDAFSTLVVVSGEAQPTRHELKNCFCVRQTLVCTQIRESHWVIPNFGVGGKQSNVYITSASDGTLVMRLQNYRIDVVLGVPFFQNREPWARFERAQP